MPWLIPVSFVPSSETSGAALCKGEDEKESGGCYTDVERLFTKTNIMQPCECSKIEGIHFPRARDA